MRVGVRVEELRTGVASIEVRYTPLASGSLAGRAIDARPAQYQDGCYRVRIFTHHSGTPTPHRAPRAQGDATWARGIRDCAYHCAIRGVSTALANIYDMPCALLRSNFTTQGQKSGRSSAFPALLPIPLKSDLLSAPLRARLTARPRPTRTGCAAAARPAAARAPPPSPACGPAGRRARARPAARCALEIFLRIFENPGPRLKPKPNHNPIIPATLCCYSPPLVYLLVRCLWSSALTEGALVRVANLSVDKMTTALRW